MHLFDVVTKSHSEIAIFIAGDILELVDSRGNAFDWIMTYHTFDIEAINHIQSEYERQRFLKLSINNFCKELRPSSNNIFRVRSANFKMKQPVVSVSVNKNFDEFGYLNDPTASSVENPRELLLFCSSSKHISFKKAKGNEMSSTMDSIVDRTQSLYQYNLMQNGLALHPRNFRTKKCIHIYDYTSDKKSGQIQML